MYSELLAELTIRSNTNPYIIDIIQELSTTCEAVIIKDPQNLLEKADWDTLNMVFDDNFHIPDTDFDLASYGPEWVLSLYGDESPGKRFRYMKDSLCGNEYVNTWTSPARYLWDDLDQYREDKLWGQLEFPCLWRYIPEINYQREDGGLVPTNQPGPVENSFTPLYSYRYLTEQIRLTQYLAYFQNREKYNYITKLHYESLLDENPKLNKLVD